MGYQQLAIAEAGMVMQSYEHVALQLCVLQCASLKPTKLYYTAAKHRYHYTKHYYTQEAARITIGHYVYCGNKLQGATVVLDPIWTNLVQCYNFIFLFSSKIVLMAK